jgi:hypothetical protein
MGLDGLSENTSKENIRLIYRLYAAFAGLPVTDTKRFSVPARQVEI